MTKAPPRSTRLWWSFMRGAGLVWLCVMASLVHAQDIVSATYEGPTDRYPHAVLGDDIEYTTLVVRLSNGAQMSANWPLGMVFEDLTPRVADLDNDGAPEVITIESSDTAGARLSVWGMRNGQLVRVVSTPHIGTRFRWLAPVAWEDLDGDGMTELAYVDRPHLAKTLRVWRYVPRSDGSASLTEVATLPGVTNHRIGWDFIVGGTRDCGSGSEMILADARWQRVMAVRFDGTALFARDIASYSPESLSAALAC